LVPNFFLRNAKIDDSKKIIFIKGLISKNEFRTYYNNYLIVYNYFQRIYNLINLNQSLK
jgi:hypothetical protein